MVLSYIWTGMIVTALIVSFFTGKGPDLSPALLEGAQSGIGLAISMAGAICLWSGVGKAMEKGGISRILSQLLKPIVCRIFPRSGKDPSVREAISANMCANLLGLGNAATPMGIQAVKRMQQSTAKDTASPEMCRLIVMNTASIQLLPTNVAALRSGLGCETPFDILPAVWMTSLASVSAGLLAAWALERIWRHD